MSVALERQYIAWQSANIKGSATVRLNEKYVKDDDGTTYELRYDPNTGTSAIVGYKVTTRARKGPGDTNTSKTETIVLFQSTPNGGTFTEKGKQLLKDNKLLNTNGTAFTEQDLRNSIQNDTLNAYNKIKKRRETQNYTSAETLETSALAAGTPEPEKAEVDGTQGGEEAKTATAVDPDASPQPDPVPTDAGGDEEEKQPAGLVDFAAEQADNLFEGLLNKFNLTKEDVNRLFLTQPSAEDIAKISAAFATSDAAISAISKGGLKYPVDAIFGGANSQDYVHIAQYQYKPPSSNTIFSADPISNVTDGVQRQTALAKRLGYVRLPMPNDVTDSNNVNWGEDAMNSLSAAITSAVTKDPLKVGGLAAAGQLLGGLTGIQGLGKIAAMAGIFSNAGGFEGAGRALENPNTQMVIGSAVSSRLLSLAGVNVSPEALLARGLGVVPNSNMELLFNSPTLRTFVFNWKMAPRDAYEATKINNILRFFKQGMAVKTTAAKVGGASLLLGTPNVFKMKFMTRDQQQLEGVGRIKECAITGVSVNYTPEGKWSAYDKGQPSSVLLTVRMQELEPVYATDYINGVNPDGTANAAGTPVKGSRTDYDPIRPNEVGF